MPLREMSYELSKSVPGRERAMLEVTTTACLFRKEQSAPLIALRPEQRARVRI